MAKRARPKLPPAVAEFFRAQGALGGKKGGPTGGKARWQGVSKAERSTIARKAARARWASKRSSS